MPPSMRIPIWEHQYIVKDTVKALWLMQFEQYFSKYRNLIVGSHHIYKLLKNVGHMSPYSSYVHFYWCISQLDQDRKIASWRGQDCILDSWGKQCLQKQKLDKHTQVIKQSPAITVLNGDIHTNVASINKDSSLKPTEPKALLTINCLLSNEPF